MKNYWPNSLWVNVLNELDIHLTSDGELVVFHDDNLVNVLKKNSVR